VDVVTTIHEILFVLMYNLQKFKQLGFQDKNLNAFAQELIK